MKQIAALIGKEICKVTKCYSIIEQDFVSQYTQGLQVKLDGEDDRKFWLHGFRTTYSLVERVYRYTVSFTGIAKVW